MANLLINNNNIIIIYNNNDNNNNIQAKSEFVIPQIKTVMKESNSILYYGPVIRNLIPAEMKYVDFT